jgi:hypothetical protein
MEGWEGGLVSLCSLPPDLSPPNFYNYPRLLATLAIKLTTDLPFLAPKVD